MALSDKFSGSLRIDLSKVLARFVGTMLVHLLSNAVLNATKRSVQDARGDQCDKCGKLLNPTELVKPRCKLDGASPVPRESKHIFLNLTDAQPNLEKWIEKSSVEGKMHISRRDKHRRFSSLV